MKKTVMIILATMLLSSLVFAGNKHKEKTQTPESQITIKQYVPYSTAGKAVMQKIYTKGEYTLWKCPSSYITDFPGESITGKNYNYFVYKNNKFHMTVNNNNKKAIYQFLTQ